MTICNFVILVGLFIAIGFIYYILYKIFSIVSDFKLDLRQNHSFTHETKYVPFFELVDKKVFQNIVQDCLKNKDGVAFELENIINNANTQEAVKNILENYNITPKEKEE